MAAAQHAPGIDELGPGHLVEKAAARAAVLPGQIGEDVGGADRDPEGHVERTKALLEEDIQHPRRENAAHRAAFDDEGCPAGMASLHAFHVSFSIVPLVSTTTCGFFSSP